ncbi:MAG: hypothetical protein JSS32_05460 [Verrucomicrobia bacterium]|nr:hypothetical protein [Verrucomicrobiota bacterium]
MWKWCFLFFAPLSLFSWLEGEYELFDEPEEEIVETFVDAYGTRVVDFDEMDQGIVLETKQIVIPGYPDAFNPSIVRWGGSLLLSFRIYNYETKTAHQTGLIWLDEEFNPIGEVQLLQMPFFDENCRMKRQDPRLFTIGERLFVTFNNVLQGISNREVRRMVWAEVFYDDGEFYALDSEVIADFEGIKDWRSEKNWVPFDYQGKAYFGYTLIPHKIMDSENWSIAASTRGDIRWDWGELRGGTPALLVDGNYLSFFHSSCSVASVHSGGRRVQHFFMGAYIFSGSFPFEIQKISSEPIFADRFYRGVPHKTWKPLQVIFPMGFIADGPLIWLVYGRQDHEVWVAKLSKEKLFESLTPVKNK